MTNRLRTRNYQRRSRVDVLSGDRYVTTYDATSFVPYGISDNSRGPGPCVHNKVKTFANGVAWHNPYTRERGLHFNDCFSLTYGALAAHNGVDRAMSTLDWKKLPTSSQFDILGIAAELDDTLAIFTRKFWEKLSYGSISWGLLPFVSDLMAIKEAIENASVALDGVPYEDGGDLVVPDSYVAANEIKNSVSGKYHVSGLVTYPGGNDILAMFDRLGFHPSLQTAWDLTPMSFIVDYILPIGRALDSLAPRGWVRAVNFEGWTSAKYDITSTYVGSTTYQGTGLKSASSHYRRGFGTRVLEVPYSPPKLPEFQLPTFKQLFDIMYVDAGRARRSNPIPFRHRRIR